MSEVTFTVTFDNPDENLEATLMPSLMLSKLREWGIEYHDVSVTGPSVQPSHVPTEFQACLYDDDPDGIDLWPHGQDH